MENFTIDVGFIISIASAIATIAAAVGIISKYLKKTLNKQIKESMEESSGEYKKYFNEELLELKNTIQSYIENQHEQNEQVRKCLLSSTRDRINQAHDYYMRKGFIGAHSLFVVEELYTSYKQLGGNSFVDRQMEDIRDLEVRSAEIDDRSSSDR